MRGPSRWFRRQNFWVRAFLLFATMLLMVVVAILVGTVASGLPFQLGDLPKLGLSLLGLAAVSVVAIWLGDRRERSRG